MIDCVDCYQPIMGRLIRDHGDPWCEPCLRDRIRRNAAANADRHIQRSIHLAAVLADIQDRPLIARRVGS